MSTQSKFFSSTRKLTSCDDFMSIVSVIDFTFNQMMSTFQDDTFRQLIYDELSGIETLFSK